MCKIYMLIILEISKIKFNLTLNFFHIHLESELYMDKTILQIIFDANLQKKNKEICDILVCIIVQKKENFKEYIITDFL